MYKILISCEYPRNLLDCLEIACIIRLLIFVYVNIYVMIFYFKIDLDKAMLFPHGFLILF